MAMEILRIDRGIPRARTDAAIVHPSRPVRIGTVLAAGALVVLTACGRGGPDDGAAPGNGSPAAEQTTEQTTAPGTDRSAQSPDGTADPPRSEDVPGSAGDGVENGGTDPDGSDDGGSGGGTDPGSGTARGGSDDGDEPGGGAAGGDGGGAGAGGAAGGGGGSGAGGAERTSPPPRVAPVIGGLPIGPVGPGEPAWYVALRAGTCDYESLSGAGAQDAASLLCQAAVTNDEALWSRGAAALAAAPLPEGCHDVAAVAMLHRLVRFHQDHPEDVPVLVDTPGTACPLSVRGLAPAPDGAGESSLGVPACGGVAVHLRGNVQDPALPVGSVQSVVVGPTPVPIRWEPTGPWFVAPPAPDPVTGGPVPVALAGSAYALEDPARSTVSLDYAPGPATCPAPGP